MTVRAAAEIDLSSISHNLAVVRDIVGSRTDIMPVVKADAYGHGIVEVAKVASEQGCGRLGVATVAEGAVVRGALPRAEICVFAPMLPGEAEDVMEYRLTPFVGDLDSARALSRWAAKREMEAMLHLEVDTGMGRAGAAPESTLALAAQIATLPGLRLTGLCTHFASAESDPAFTDHQLSVFLQAASAMREAGIRIDLRHAANSAAILGHPSFRLDLVRPGLLLYGIVPDMSGTTPAPPLQPALRLTTRIALVRALPAGDTLSYGRTHKLKRDSRIATLPIGYGDGYPRDLSNVGCVLVAGQRAPIVGRVCMDVTLVDITHIPEAAAGDEAVLIGEMGGERIGVEEIARAIETTPHDVTTRLTARLPRIHVSGRQKPSSP